MRPESRYGRPTNATGHRWDWLTWKAGGLEASTVDALIDASSVDTNVPLLDKLVKGPEMFDAASYPAIRFVSTRFVRTQAAAGRLEGELTVRGVTRPVALDVTFNGYGVNPLTKDDTLGFSARGKFSRAQFGLSTWYPAVGDEVQVRIEAEFAKKAISAKTPNTMPPKKPRVFSKRRSRDWKASWSMHASSIRVPSIRARCPF